jgi:hypothetical protein
VQKFYVLVNLVQRHPVDELVAELKARKIISKEQVIRESMLDSLQSRNRILTLGSAKQG